MFILYLQFCWSYRSRAVDRYTIVFIVFTVSSFLSQMYYLDFSLTGLCFVYFIHLILLRFILLSLVI